MSFGFCWLLQVPVDQAAAPRSQTVLSSLDRPVPGRQPGLQTALENLPEVALPRRIRGSRSSPPGEEHGGWIGTWEHKRDTPKIVLGRSKGKIYARDKKPGKSKPGRKKLHDRKRNRQNRSTLPGKKCLPQVLSPGSRVSSPTLVPKLCLGTPLSAKLLLG